jgi:hypothetical protein
LYNKALPFSEIEMQKFHEREREREREPMLWVFSAAPATHQVLQDDDGPLLQNLLLLSLTPAVQKVKNEIEA